MNKNRSLELEIIDQKVENSHLQNKINKLLSKISKLYK